MARFRLVVIWLAVPEMVVQGFAAAVMVLVVAGVLVVLGIGSSRARRPGRQANDALPPAEAGLTAPTSALPPAQARVRSRGRTGASRP
jgi:hypothetical protein